MSFERHSFVDLDKEQDCLKIANRLIDVCQLDFPLVTSLSMVGCKFFVSLFEKVFGDPVQDQISGPLNSVDEAHNVQAVIDAMSLDIISISLTYITGDDIIDKNETSIHNLLEVFECYIDHPPKTVEASTKKENKREVCGYCGYGKEQDVASLPTKDPCPLCLYASKKEVKWKRDNIFLSHLRRLKSPVLDQFEDSKSDRRSPKMATADLVSSLSSSTHSAVARKKQRTGPVHAGLFRHSSPLGPEEVAVPRSRSKNRTSDRRTPVYDGRGSSQKTLDKQTVQTGISLSDGKRKNLEYTESQSSSANQEDNIQKKASSSSHRRRQSAKKHLRSDVYSSTEQKDDSTNNFLLIREKPKRRSDRNIESIASSHEMDVADMYAKNLETKVKTFLEERTQHRRRASEIKKTYLRSLRSPMTRSKSTRVINRSYVLPYNLRPKSSNSVTPNSKLLPPFKCPVAQRSVKSYANKENSFIDDLREEFPGVHLSPKTVQSMADKYQKHLFSMQNTLKKTIHAKSQAQIQTEEATKRQKIIANILKKNIRHNHQLRSVNEQKQLERTMRATERDSRIESARLKQYHDEFTTQMRKRMQKRNYNEELLLKNAFNEGLHLQKEQVRLMRQQFKEQEAKDKKNHQLYLDSLENFYQTQFDMLATSLAVEKKEMEGRIKEQQKDLRTMKRENKAKLEKDIRDMQEQLVRVNEEIHFRERDAENFVDRLRDQYSAHPNKKL